MKKVRKAKGLAQRLREMEIGEKMLVALSSYPEGSVRNTCLKLKKSNISLQCNKVEGDMVITRVA